MARLRETRDMVGETSPFILTGMFWFLIVPAFVAAVSFGIYWFAAPARVAIDNRVFHESQAYNDGMARDLDNMRMQWLSATPEAKTAIAATVQHRFAGYDAARLPADLQLFLAQVKQ